MVASVVLAGEFLFPNTYLLHMSRSILHKVVREIIIVGIALGLRRVDHGPHTAMIFSLRGNELGENRKLSKSVGRWRPAPRGRRSRPAAPKAAELKGNGKEVVQHDLVLLELEPCCSGRCLRRRPRRCGHPVSRVAYGRWRCWALTSYKYAEPLSVLEDLPCDRGAELPG